MTSIYDLVYDYLDRFYKDEKVDRDTKQTIHKEIKRLLKRGWCSLEIVRRFQQIEQNKTLGPQVRKRIGPSVRKLFLNQTPETINIIDPDTFYYHNILRVTSSPPKREIDYDSGEVTNISEPYFLEMRASLEVDDVVAYYCKQFGIRPHRQEIARFRGSIQWILNMDDVEILLFMIDRAANMCRAEDYPTPRTPMDIRRYRREAMEARSLKETESVLSGGNKIVRKKRTRSG